MAKKPGRAPRKELTAEEKAQKLAEKRTRFVKLANIRANKAIKAVGLLANLANRNQYDFTAEDVKAMLDPLDKMYNRVSSAFENALKGGPAAKSEEWVKLS